jgi:hypothetical protein
MGEQSWLRTSSFDDCCRSLERKKKRRKNKSLIRREAPFRFKQTIALEIPNQRRAHPWRKLKLRMMRESVWKKKRRKNKVAAAQDKQAIPHYTSPFNDVISPFQERRTASSSRHSSKYSRRYYLAVIRLVSQWKTLLFCETGTQRKCPGPLSTSLFILRKKEFHSRWVHHQLPCMACCYLGPRILLIQSSIAQWIKTPNFVSIPFVGGFGSGHEKDSGYCIWFLKGSAKINISIGQTEKPIAESSREREKLLWPRVFF